MLFVFVLTYIFFLYVFLLCAFACVCAATAVLGDELRGCSSGGALRFKKINLLCCFYGSSVLFLCFVVKMAQYATHFKLGLAVRTANQFFIFFYRWPYVSLQRSCTIEITLCLSWGRKHSGLCSLPSGRYFQKCGTEIGLWNGIPSRHLLATDWKCRVR